MIKDKDNFTCNKMYSSICSTNLAGQKNCDCCDCFYNKCSNCSYTNTGMCIKCKFQKDGDKTDWCSKKIFESMLKSTQKHWYFKIIML
jgi:hypothetical protein